MLLERIYMCCVHVVYAHVCVKVRALVKIHTGQRILGVLL